MVFGIDALLPKLTSPGRAAVLTRTAKTLTGESPVSTVSSAGSSVLSPEVFAGSTCRRLSAESTTTKSCGRAWAKLAAIKRTFPVNGAETDKFFTTFQASASPDQGPFDSEV